MKLHNDLDQQQTIKNAETSKLKWIEEAEIE